MWDLTIIAPTMTSRKALAFVLTEKKTYFARGV